MPGSQAAPGEAAEAGHLAEAGHIAAALEAVRASAAARARYSLSTARRTVVEERQLVAAIEASLASHASWWAPRTRTDVTLARSRGSHACRRRQPQGRYTREVTRLACMQAEAATGACTGAPASHVAISRYGAQHGAPCRHLEVRRSARRSLSSSRGAALSTARVDPVVASAREAPSARGRLDVAFSRPLLSLSPDEGEH